MSLFEKRKISAQFFLAFRKSRINFENLQKKLTLIADVFWTDELRKTYYINV